MKGKVLGLAGLLFISSFFPKTANAWHGGAGGGGPDSPSLVETKCRCAFPIKGVEYIHPKNWQVKVAIDILAEEYGGFTNPKDFAEACGIDYGDLRKDREREFMIIENFYNIESPHFKRLIDYLHEMYDCDCPWDEIRREVKIESEVAEPIKSGGAGDDVGI